MSDPRFRILLIGSNGQVGHELQLTLAPLDEVISADRATLDLTNEPAIRDPRDVTLCANCVQA